LLTKTTITHEALRKSAAYIRIVLSGVVTARSKMQENDKNNSIK